MKIILLRHGKVNYPPLTIISASSFAEWVSCYDANGLDVSSKPTNEAINIAKQTNVVVCSALPRSLESAKLLKIEDIRLSHSLFNEAGLPTANWKFPRLSVRIWVILFRLAWFFGYSANSETLKQAKGRSLQAANKLIKMAKEHKSVLFVGHGIINRFIAHELRELGWEGSKNPSRKYWEFGVFSKKT